MTDEITGAPCPESVRELFGLAGPGIRTTLIGGGLINRTWKIESDSRQFILQRINDRVFTQPKHIAGNIRLLAAYLGKHKPGYLFPAPLPALSGEDMIFLPEEGYYRLFGFVDGSRTIATVKDADEAYEAARQFGQFSGLLDRFDITSLRETIPDFHNLDLRWRQLEIARTSAAPTRLAAVNAALAEVEANRNILLTFARIARDGSIPKRVMHHDTKISNVLFDAKGKGLCVIDLDTVMPGYFISDLGDMFRTYLPAVNEEEPDISLLGVRRDIYQAIIEGYLGKMGDLLNPAEKELIFFSGPFLVYMQAIRFLTDYLNQDVYYATNYPEQNLFRTLNQLDLLAKIMAQEKDFQRLISSAAGKQGIVRP